MDKLIRVIIMIICFIAIPHIGNVLYADFKDLNKSEKIKMYGYYIFFSWFMIIPCYEFMECLKYLIQ